VIDDECDIDYGPERAWFVELCFWRPSVLNDEEMELFFSDRDGRWSRQTKEAMKRFGAKGLDLNQNWALVERGWCCPGCGRSKNEIFRLSSRGILLAKVEEHHDHLRDYVGRRSRELFGERWIAEARPGAGLIADTLEGLVSSFSPEFVCSECNTADGKAKFVLKGEIPPYFSFSPAEISKFVIASPNTDHGIDADKLRETWAKCQSSIQSRIEYIDHSLGLIQSGILYRDRGTSSFRVAQSQFESPYQLHQALLRESARDVRGYELSRMMDEFLARSVQKDSPTLAPKSNPVVEKIIVPTSGEYASYCDPVSPAKWQQTSENWHCPICHRAKREVVRKAKSGNWAGGIRELIEPIEETDSFALHARRTLLKGFSHEYVMCGSTTTFVCSDCKDVTARLKLKRQDITEINLLSDDIRCCLTNVRAHAPHDVDWEEATLRAQSNRAIGLAWAAYWKHQSMVSRLDAWFGVSKRLDGEERAIEIIAGEIMFEAEIDDMAEAIKLARWVLIEAARAKAASEDRRAEYLAAKAKNTDS